MSSPIQVETSAGTLSARVSGPQQHPHGLVVALHGGTYDSAYYDAGPATLHRLAEPLGLCVVALDRPGYGAGAGLDPKHLGFAAQAALVAEAVERLVERYRPADGVVLVGHSIGGMVALHVAADAAVALRGVEVSGIGAAWQPGMVEMWGSFVGDAPVVEVPAEPHAAVMFGPQDAASAELRAADAGLIRPMPMPELVDVVGWAEAFPAVGSRVRVPVSVTFPEHDNIWSTDAEARDLATACLAGSPAVDVRLLPGAGHCAELHRPARQYGLQQLAFVEACLSS